MKKKIAAVLILLLATPWPAQTGELEDRDEISNRAANLFRQEKFAELDSIAEEYRWKQSRTSSGLWKLTLFYAGLSSVTDSEIKEEKYWHEIESKALRWAASHPNSPTPYNVYAEILIAHAWKFRGSGWAHEVKQEDWKPFHEQIAKARHYLMQHKRIASTDPRWYEVMLKIARAEGWERKQFDELAAESASRFPYFYQIYFSAINYLVPKWHGNKVEIEKFANFSVEQTKTQEGMGMYARVYWYASQTEYGNGLFTKSAVVWNRMKLGIDDVLARYPDQWNINNFARFACLSRDKSKTKELMARINAQPLAKAWENNLKHFESCKAWSAS